MATAEQAAEARGALVRLVFGNMAAEVVSTAARFGVADLIGDAERTAVELADTCGAHPESMGRLLRAMAALELLTEVGPGCFALTPAGALLRTDRPDSMHAFTRMFTDPALVRPWRRLDASVRTGRSVFGEEFGTDWFSYLDSQPELSATFNASMSQGTRLTAAQLPAAYDFSRFSTVVDVGGGDGTLITAILRAHPALRGILFDTPAGLAQAEATLQQAEVHDRCVIHSGDFFTSVPDGGDLYLINVDQQSVSTCGNVTPAGHYASVERCWAPFRSVQRIRVLPCCSQALLPRVGDGTSVGVPAARPGIPRPRPHEPAREAPPTGGVEEHLLQLWPTADKPASNAVDQLDLDTSIAALGDPRLI